MDSDKASPSIIRLWRVWRTAKEMMRDRGYMVLEEDTTMSLAEFTSKFGREDGEPDRSRLNFSCLPSEEMLAKYTPAPTKKDPNPVPQIGSIWVEFNSDENVGLKQLRDYMGHLLNGNFYSGVMITVQAMTGMAIRLLRGATSMSDGPKGGVEVFVEQDLLVNITKHELVPKHVLLSAEEKQQLLKRYRLKETQLPRIQSTDPVAKYLGLRRGSVVKIIRKAFRSGLATSTSKKWLNISHKPHLGPQQTLVVGAYTEQSSSSSKAFGAWDGTLACAKKAPLKAWLHSTFDKSCKLTLHACARQDSRFVSYIEHIDPTNESRISTQLSMPNVFNPSSGHFRLVEMEMLFSLQCRDYVFLFLISFAFIKHGIKITHQTHPHTLPQMPALPRYNIFPIFQTSNPNCKLSSTSSTNT
ncbi:hypothetical protein LEMA_P010700.1 [Plenodomus lingam JN3]|uniref:DNA-directed RNA polymerases I, II, and III subunit RPABC1 n=1 Tax=Leptosphaeria maculans (strain JN3 / isolate v23.1.3 / race Av1-4-5-6-7-8) TaxID=985895 RepID=E5ACT1_LEPMJ|nr:hypothetical protein LEMA_P010700.1 [Plenodomus lingam JN3]CBY02283.1 hypothetical protein LEMA_P010700.1 [Plenodomus lingam JN3]